MRSVEAIKSSIANNNIGSLESEGVEMEFHTIASEAEFLSAQEEEEQQQEYNPPTSTSPVNVDEAIGDDQWETVAQEGWEDNQAQHQVNNAWGQEQAQDNNGWVQGQPQDNAWAQGQPQANNVWDQEQAQDYNTLDQGQAQDNAWDQVQDNGQAQDNAWDQVKDQGTEENAWGQTEDNTDEQEPAMNGWDQQHNTEGNSILLDSFFMKFAYN